VPATSLSSTAPLYMVGFGNTFVTVWTVSGVPGVGGGVSVTSENLSFTYDPVAPYAPQKGTSDLLVVLGGVRDVVFRSGSLWAAATSGCIPANDTIKRACLRLVELKKPGSAFSITQDIQYGVSGQYNFFPAISVDVDGKLVVGFGRSSTTTYAAFWTTGRRTSDTLNTLSSPGLLAAGQAPYGDTDATVENLRWGNYFGAAADPVNQHHVWLVGQYASFPAATYSTRVELFDAQLF
jgi:hypothetical protein